MASLFSSSFETASFTDWTGTSGTPTRASNQVIDGTYSMEVNAQPEGVYKDHGAKALGTTFYSRVYFRASAAPAGGTWASVISHDSTVAVEHYWVDIEEDSCLRLIFNDITIGSPSSALTAGQWYCVELKSSHGTGATDSAEAKLSGIPFASETGASRSNAQLQYTTVGNDYGGGAPGNTMYFDACETRDDYYPGPLPAFTTAMIL